MKLEQSDFVKLGLNYLAVKGPENVVVGSSVDCSRDLGEIIFEDADSHLRLAGTELSAKGSNEVDPVNNGHVLYEYKHRASALGRRRDLPEYYLLR